MDSINNDQDTSTPKRRRLGNTKIFRKSLLSQSNLVIDCSPITAVNAENEKSVVERCESPHLPCNQVEFLYDSSNSNVTSDIPSTSGILNDPQIQWQSLDVSIGKLCDTQVKPSQVTKNRIIMKEIEDISDDMFNSKLEQSEYAHEEKKFNQEIEQSFDVINESITNFHEAFKNNSCLFDTKDSFLLDIRESGVERHVQHKVDHVNHKIEPDFYGLPVITKGLFKTYRNIDKLYDWQEECLNLDAIKKRRNLIYALPTSGGKTLVAEVLMLREVLNRKKNALFILPFVAIVQEKIWALSPFAVQLDFLVEEYAGGKGHIPPKKRRKKNSIYVATIEKGLALVRSLIELDRLNEIGLIVVDELHLIGEKGRGGTLEMLLSTVIFTNQDIQIVGMSATIGNLHEIAKFLRADVFQRQFRPVELVEYVKLGNMLHRIQWGDEGVEFIPHRELTYDYSALAVSVDPDALGGLVAEVVPDGSCLVFCATKRSCENVAALLCKLQRRDMAAHRAAERQALQRALGAEGGGAGLLRAARCGVAFHHAGLAADERALIEHAFRSGVLSVVCCTSTLAAGVNLPAQRVIIRAPRVGRDFLSLAAYRQMAGRAGRAGVCATGESIIICNAREWPQLREVLRGGIAPARSMLRDCLPSLMLSAVALGLATSAQGLRDFTNCTLMAVTADDKGSIELSSEEAIDSLLQCGALERSNSSDDRLAVSKLGAAAIKGCLELPTARQLLQELQRAARSLVLLGGLHLLYLVAPHGADALVRPDYRHYYSLYCDLDDEGVQTARVLGITEVNAVKMMTGKAITSVPERVLCRFYVALALRDVWRQMPCAAVADKYGIPRGTVQAVMASAAAFASCASRFCDALEGLWGFGALLHELAARLQTCAAPALQQLLELPGVQKARALQLSRAGWSRVEHVARASVEQLTAALPHLSRRAAHHLVSAARMMLIEKVENLRAEADDVLEELNTK